MASTPLGPRTTTTTTTTTTTSATTTTRTTSTSGLAASSVVEDGGSGGGGRPLRVVFVHMDWGIGGAEQLMLQLAQASVEVGHSIQLVTTRCDPGHCFASLKPITGNLYPHLRIHGAWMPQDILGGRFRAVMSTLRILYLSYCLYAKQTKHEPSPDVIVLDVLPTPLPFLEYLFPQASCLFYCHFPDQLLTTSTTTDDKNTATSRSIGGGGVGVGWYRWLLNMLENWTLPFADLIVVNSKFTQQIVLETFPSLKYYDKHHHHHPEQQLPVLYPALDTSALDRDDDNTPVEFPWSTSTAIKPFVSLNRYERKKNLELFLRAAQWIHANHPTVTLPPLVIAGGYDTKCVENVEYRGQLQRYVDQNIPNLHVYFFQSISDAQRTALLKRALAVIYTPTQEHFGIVPVEAMYCGTPVVAVNSGGPLETVVPETTGFLCPPHPEEFGMAMLRLILDPKQAARMGRAGRDHVLQTFGNKQRFLSQWNELVQTTVQRGQVRQARYYQTYQLIHTLTSLLDALSAFCLLFLVTFVLQRAGILHSNHSMVAAIRKLWRGGEEL